jgi:hypothetical protein
MDGIRSEIRGAPGGRTRYPMTMRRVKLEAAMAERAISKTNGVILREYPPLEINCHFPNLIRIAHEPRKLFPLPVWLRLPRAGRV